MTKEEFIAIRQSRPPYINSSDEEIEVKVNNFNTRVLNWVDHAGCTYIRSLNLPSDTEQMIISKLLKDVKDRTHRFLLSSEHQNIFKNDVSDIISYYIALARYEAASLLAEAIISENLIISAERIKYIRCLVPNMVDCTDDEIRNRFNFYVNFLFLFKGEYAATFIKTKKLPSNIENELIFTIRYKIKFHILVHLLSSSSGYILNELDEILEEYFQEVTAKYYILISEAIMRADPKKALAEANRSWYQMVVKETLLAIRNEELSKESKIYKNFASDTISFLQNKINTAPEKALTIGIGELEEKNNNRLMFEDSDFLLPIQTLTKIYREFNGELWEDMPEQYFYILFDINNSHSIQYKILKLKVTDFTALIWSMNDVSGKNHTQDYFIKPLLIRGGGAASNLVNIKWKRINSKQPKAKKLMKRINNVLK